jgi:hypothetical protein
MNIITTLILVCLSFSSFSQTFKQNQTFGLSLSHAPKEVNVALSWKQMYSITVNKKIKLGFGVRFNGYLNNDKYYVTATAYLTSGEKGPQVLFIENIQ